MGLQAYPMPPGVVTPVKDSGKRGRNQPEQSTEAPAFEFGFQSGEEPTMVVLDHFLTPEDRENIHQNYNDLLRKGTLTMDLNNDGLPDMVPHGDIVSSFGKASGYRIMPLNIRADEDNNPANMLKQVLPQVESGALEVDVVNISMGPLGFPMSFGHLSRMAGIENLTAENIGEKRAEVLEAFREKYRELGLRDIRNSRDLSPDKVAIKRTVELAEVAEQLQAKGVEVVIAAGNDGPGHLNLYNLVPGTTNVGALDESGNPFAWSANNSLVNRWAPGGPFQPQPVTDEQGNVTGYDVTNDGKADLSTDVIYKPPYDGKRPDEVPVHPAEAFSAPPEDRPVSGLVSLDTFLALSQPGQSAEALAQSRETFHRESGIPETAPVYVNIFRKYPSNPLQFFAQQPDGRLAFIPMENPDRDNAFTGTSYAAPFIKGHQAGLSF